MEKMTQNNCQVESCKNPGGFSSLVMLKRHLKEQHNRVLCEICLKFQTALMSESRLFTESQLQRHLKKGDQDEDGNIIFLHPYCSFCDQSLYSETQLVKHMNDTHFSCHVCGDQYKYRFYNTYKQLETHFRISHYVCTDAVCLEKTFIVFRSRHELEMHQNKVHSDVYQQGTSKMQQKALSQYNY